MEFCLAVFGIALFLPALARYTYFNHPGIFFVFCGQGKFAVKSGLHDTTKGNENEISIPQASDWVADLLFQKPDLKGREIYAE
jgi:hypothetical protein